MDIAQLLDIFLHLDKHLATVAQAYGVWIYALLFLIVFVETGVVVMPFLPGDSLLFVAGALAGIGALNLPMTMAVLFVAAVVGDNCNYWIGRYFGPKVFRWENSRFSNKAAFDKTHDFYEKYGAMTIIIARFMPFVRTFAPFVAGVGAMTYPKYVFFDTLGGIIWVGSLVTLGYFVGNMDWVKANFSLVTLAMIVIPALPAIITAARHFLTSRRRTSP